VKHAFDGSRNASRVRASGIPAGAQLRFTSTASLAELGAETLVRLHGHRAEGAGPLWAPAGRLASPWLGRFGLGTGAELTDPQAWFASSPGVGQPPVILIQGQML
jgi:hypothetical protein